MRFQEDLGNTHIWDLYGTKFNQPPCFADRKRSVGVQLGLMQKARSIASLCRRVYPWVMNDGGFETYEIIGCIEACPHHLLRRHLPRF